MTLALLEGRPAGNVLPFKRKRPSGGLPPGTVLSRWARHIIICAYDAFPGGTVRRLEAARPQDCFAVIDGALDAGEGSRYLRILPIWNGLESELLAAGGNFEVITFCIEPTHAHVLIREAEDFPLDAAVERWKEKALSGWSARGGSSTRIWAPGYYDTVLSDPREIEAARMAIELHRTPPSRYNRGR